MFEQSEKSRWVPLDSRDFSSFFAIRIHVLAEQSDLFCPMTFDNFDTLLDNLVQPRYLMSTGIGNDAKSTVIITSSLNNHISTSSEASRSCLTRRYDWNYHPDQYPRHTWSTKVLWETLSPRFWTTKSIVSTRLKSSSSELYSVGVSSFSPSWRRVIFVVFSRPS